MAPRLVFLSGPLTGQAVPLCPQGLSIGRHAANALRLRDPSASRRHCAVEAVNGGFLLRDLESRRGTLVNGRPVGERLLEDGDLIAVGETLLLVQLRTEAQDSAAPEEELFTARTTLHLAPEDALWSRPAGDVASRAATDPSGRVARDLQTLLQGATALQAARGTEELARGLLDRALAALPAERAALLLADRGESGIAAAFALDRQGSSEPFPVSGTLLRRVLAGPVAVLAEDVLLDLGLAGAESVRLDRIRSLLAVPLTQLGRPLGLLYADVREPGPAFDEGHLQLLTALGGIAVGALTAVRQMEWLAEENRRLSESLGREMVGDSPRMREVYRLLGRAAPTGSTVLLRGESGTGKELAARALHQGSARAGRPFVAVNCATLSENLLESELFGHERGAFTGAVARKEGKAEAADGGTLFLDEVGEIPLPLQARLLRFLQEREVERLGGTRPIRVDVRVVAATNRDLERAIREGTFREDLYYRLNVITLHLPPLRERRQDIPLLASYFAALTSRRLGRPLAGFTPEARACLQRYDWPGNVRELANAVERAIVLGEGDLIRPEDLPEALLEPGDVSGDITGVTLGLYHETVRETKKRLIQAAVTETAGNVTRAAARLGLQPTYLHRLIRNLGLRDEIRD